MRIRIINHYLVRLLLIIAAALSLLEGLGKSVLLITSDVPDDEIQDYKV